MPPPSNPSNHDAHGSHGSEHEPEDHKLEAVDPSLGYEKRDIGVGGIVVFMVSMAIFVVVTAVVCYGIGKVINARMNKEDGPNSKWTQTVDIRQLGNMPSSPAMQNKVAALMQSFPTPRLQLDNGDQEVADLHARENLLLDHYSWVNESKGEVRIPIERAMEMIAQEGLPMAASGNAESPNAGPKKNEPLKNESVTAETQNAETLMTGDSRPVVTLPLTDGFAPTGFEQQQADQRAIASGREEDTR